MSVPNLTKGTAMTNETGAGETTTILDLDLANRDKNDDIASRGDDPGKSQDESCSGDTQEEDEDDEKTKKKRRLVVLKDHIVFTPGDPPTYYCGVCKKSFHLRSVARYHNYCGAPADDKPYKCELCGQGFVTSGHHSYHMKSHTGLLPFKCDVCDRSFKQLVKLKRHKKSHTGERPFQCTQCSRFFSAKHVLKEHTFTHSGERPYGCNQCTKTFNHMSSLRKHKLSHSDSFSYTCEDCGKTFKMSWNLAMHKKTHQRDRKHSCTQCPRAFKLASDLKRHASVHKEDLSPFCCDECSITFRRRDTLVRHMKNIHPSTSAPGSCGASKEVPNKSAAARQLSCSTATPKKPANEEQCPPPTSLRAVRSVRSSPVRSPPVRSPPVRSPPVRSPPVRSHPVPVICSTGRTGVAGNKGTENYVSTITKATHIVRKDQSGVAKVHTIITTTPLEAEMTGGGSGTRPPVLPATNRQYYSMPDSLAMAGDPAAIPGRSALAVPGRALAVPGRAVPGRASVLRRSNMGVILYCGPSSHDAAVAGAVAGAGPPVPVTAPELARVWRPQVIMSNDK